MRVVNDRPPCLETPWRYFREDFTPNEAFYVRWHLQAFPTVIDLAAWRLTLDGHVERPSKLSMDELRRMPSMEIVAVNQCSGNSRALSVPRVSGAQWRNGAMGNARWKGVRLRDVLDHAGVRAGAVDVSFDGLDEGSLVSVPDFVKSLPVDLARSEEVLLAYEMNGEALPILNGFPLRVVAPGMYATYWVKALHRIAVHPKPFDGYWMTKAYKIPANPQAKEAPDQLAAKTVPINRMNVRSFFVLPEPDRKLAVGRSCEFEGVAFDGGSGIREVAVSVDGGRAWLPASLGPDHGKYSFRRWRFSWTPGAAGNQVVQVRAMNVKGESQTNDPIWNRGGYMRNVIEELPVSVV